MHSPRYMPFYGPSPKDLTGRAARFNFEDKEYTFIEGWHINDRKRITERYDRGYELLFYRP
jgi:hypothetical protein